MRQFTAAACSCGKGQGRVVCVVGATMRVLNKACERCRMLVPAASRYASECRTMRCAPRPHTLCLHAALRPSLPSCQPQPQLCLPKMRITGV